MDPITIGIAVVVVAFIATRRPAVDVPASGVQATGGAAPRQPGPEEIAQVMFSGAGAVADGVRDAVMQTIDNAGATARQRAAGIAGGLDPANIGAGNAQAARDFMSRGLADVQAGASAAGAVAERAAGSTATGRAVMGRLGNLRNDIAQTGAQAMAAGASVAEATQQAVANAKATAEQAAQDADNATAAFINNNQPAPDPLSMFGKSY